MLEIPVKLRVKAPNQQIEDQTIQCNLSWTIKRLKGYLSEVYPSKPNTEDQRLIYYGQLLNDSVTLKDVFTRYEAEEETHTVHLVCMPSKESLKMQARKMAEESNKKAKEISSNGPSTSQRLGMNDNDVFGENNRESHPMTTNNYFHTATYQNWINGINANASGTNNYMQQWAWMQQIYANYYLSLYMDMVARQNGFRDGFADPRQTEDAHNAEHQANREAEDDDNRRDWLDYFCILSRLLVLLAILYFYSSPARFFIVSSLGIALYLYQIGFFRVNQLQGLENNNELNIGVDNNNVLPPNEVGRAARGGGGGAGGGNLPAAAAAAAEQAGPAANVVDNPEHPSFVALTWTFVTSFFSSIIPETQNAL